MKQCLTCCLAVVFLTIAASAATVNCVSVPIQLTAGGASPTFTCNGLTFSNFVVRNFTGENQGLLSINTVTYDTNSGIVVLSENPGLGSGGHLNLFYQVSGPLAGIDLSIAGVGGTVIERACANPIPQTGALANLCTDASGVVSAEPLGQVIVHSGDPGQPIRDDFPIVNTAYIFKDIVTAQGGGLTTMNESFTPIPEPLSLLLVGSALAGLGLIRRGRSQA